MRNLAGHAFVTIIALLTIAASPGRAAGNEVVLVRDGKAVTTIVTAESPAPAVNLAAMELRYFVELITGAELPIVDDSKNVTGPRILIGKSKHTNKLGLDDSEFGYMDTLITFASDTVVLFGRDEPRNDTMETIDYTRARMMKGPEDPILVPGDLDYQGSLRATYRFIEEYCDLHMLGPFELNFIYTPCKTLTVRGSEDHHRSSLLTKTGSLTHSDYTTLWGGRYDTQNRALYHRRMRWGGKPWYINHTFQHLKYDYRFTPPVKPTEKSDKNYAKKLRDYEARMAVFERDIPAVSSRKTNQFCFSSRTLIDQIAQDARDFFDGKLGNKGDKDIQKLEGRADVFPVVPLDGGGYCKCDKCMPLQDAGRGRAVYDFNHGRYSDYVHSLVNAVARELAKTHPNKYIGTLAYEQYYWMPKTFKMEKNTVIAPCMGTMCWGVRPVVRANEEGWYKKWVQASKAGEMGPIYLWNYDFVITYPTYYAVERGHLVKEWLNDGVQGIFHCGGPEPVGMYVTNKLYENKDLDPEELIEDYFRRYFGPAAKPMRALYDELNDLTWNVKNYPLATLKRGAYIHIRLAEPDFIYTDERVRKLRELIDQASQLGRSEPYKSRIAGWESAVVEKTENNIHDHHGRKASNHAAQMARLCGQQREEGFIHSVTCYPANHWYSGRRPEALVDASDMEEGQDGFFGTKNARFKPKGSGFYWRGYFPAEGAWLLFDLGGVYDLDQIHVWNYNDRDGNTDWGLRDATVAYARDWEALHDDNWTELPPLRFNRAPTRGKAGADNVIDLGGKEARYVYIHARGSQGKANWRVADDAAGGIFPNERIGLGKVRFYGRSLQCPMPMLSFVADNLEMKLKLSVPAEDQADIHYTIDGGIPDRGSPAYTGPLAISSDVVLRARAYAPGKLASDYAPVKINYTSAYMNLIEPYEVANGKPVTASGSENAERAARFINDGKTGKGSAWWSANHPLWGQIDLGEPVRIGKIWLQPWWDDEPNGRACTYRVEVSVDGREWKQLVDWSRNKTPSTSAGDFHHFAPVTVKYVKVRDIRWLCEIKVYKALEK